MAKLLIVESPAKAKTITKYLGRGYSVKASMGHLRDLPKKELGVDLEHNFIPKYIPIEGKDKLIGDLQEAAQKADFVYLATDPDREGEAISWHLKELLNLPDDKTKRITFNEITQKAVTRAVEMPRELDMNLVDAQQARRILDRIVGYKLSPFLWRKVRSGLSAGRVQSVVTRLIVDREREIRAFVPKEYWSVDVTLEEKNKEFLAKFYGSREGKQELNNQAEADRVLKDIEGNEYVVSEVKKTQKKRQPTPPFITSTLQQEASRRFSMTTKRVMAVAQELYEGVDLNDLGPTGLITYMRTDSLRISTEASDEARTYIEDRFGSEYMPSKTRVFKSKKDAQDAHEAIRPAHPGLAPDDIKNSLTPDQYKLYKLIWSRFMASQMSDALLSMTQADIVNSGWVFRATGQTVIFPGFLALYEESKEEEDEESAPLPPLEAGDTPKHIKTEPKQHFTQPPARYTEASLIKAMEEKGIGRPSTYAPTVSVVLEREYVAKEGRALRPTALGEAVTDLMIDKFNDIIDVGFTASMEDKLDNVEEGREDFRQVLSEFYGGFAQQLSQAEKDLDKKRIKVPDEKSGVICDLCGREMVIKSGKFGKFLACPGYPECKNTKPISQDTGVSCPLCGAKLLKKKSKSGYYYYGCEKHPACQFMTWDTPIKKICPQCGGVLFKRYTKEEKKNVCYKPGCGYEEPLPTRKKKEETEGEPAGEKKPAAQKTPSKKQPAKKSSAKKTEPSPVASTGKKAVSKAAAGKKTAKAASGKKAVSKAAAGKKPTKKKEAGKE